MSLKRKPTDTNGDENGRAKAPRLSPEAGLCTSLGHVLTTSGAIQQTLQNILASKGHEATWDALFQYGVEGGYIKVGFLPLSSALILWRTAGTPGPERRLDATENTSQLTPT